MAVSAELGLPWVDIAYIDHTGPVRLTCHPSWLEAPASPEFWAVSQPSGELWQAVVAGELTDDHLSILEGPEPAIATYENLDGIGRSQLLGSTWLDRTMVSLYGTYASPAPATTPTILWVTTGDDLRDCWDFWNTRALGPRTFARMPIFLVPFEDVLHWDSFDKHLLSSLDRPNEFSVDVIITSESTSDDDLHELAKRLGLEFDEEANTRIGLVSRFPVPTDRRKPPFTYCIHDGVSHFTNFDRRYGAVTLADAHFFTGRTSTVTFDSPVNFKEGGRTLVRLESQMFEGLPRRDRVAALIASNAIWRYDALQIGVMASSKFRLELSVPRLSEALHTLLQDSVKNYSLSDKGSLAAAFLQREGHLQALLEPNLFETIRALTTPRSKSLVRDLARAVGESELSREIVEVAQSWAIQGKRVYKNVSGIPGLGGGAAAAALERLCALGWAERGLEIKCATCHTSSFIRLGSIPAKFGAKCPACDEMQQYTLSGSGPTVFYRLDGLSDRASDQGVFPHLLTIAALTRLEVHSWFMPGVDVVFHDEARNEADVIGLHGGQFVVGEVKTTASEFTDQQLEKDIAVARRLGADVYLMAAPDQISDETRELAGRLCTAANIKLMVLAQDALRPSPSSDS